MEAPWIEVMIDGRTARHELDGTRLVIAGAGSDVPVPTPGEGELQLWSSPPKIVRAGRGAAPLLNGKAVEEAPLSDGDTLQWGGAVIVFHHPSPVLEELVDAAPARAGLGAAAPRASAAGSASPAEGDARAWRRVLAGMLAEQKLADKAATQRWQQAVIRGEFDADAAATDILDASAARHDDPKIMERASRLERDLLMASYQTGIRGAARSARRATRSGSAFLVANLVAITAYTLLVMALAFLARAKFGWSFDGAIDDTLAFFSDLVGVGGG